MSFLTFSGIDYSYPSAAIDSIKVLSYLTDSDEGGTLPRTHSTYANSVWAALEASIVLTVRELGGDNDLIESIQEACYEEAKDPQDLTKSSALELVEIIVLPMLNNSGFDRGDIASASSYLEYAFDPGTESSENTCNYETSHMLSVQWTRLSHPLHEGGSWGEPCLFLIETREGDPRGPYSDQSFWFGPAEEFPFFNGMIMPSVDDETLRDAIDPAYVGGCDALQIALDLDEDDRLPGGYAIVRDDSDCPCFNGEALQFTTPTGDIIDCNFYWDGEYVV